MALLRPSGRRSDDYSVDLSPTLWRENFPAQATARAGEQVVGARRKAASGGPRCRRT